MNKQQRAQFIAEALKLVGKSTGVEPEEIFGLSRLERISHARQLAIYIVRRSTGMSYPQLGRLFDRHYTLAIKAVQKVEGRIKTIIGCAEMIEDICAALKSLNPEHVHK